MNGGGRMYVKQSQSQIQRRVVNSYIDTQTRTALDNVERVMYIRDRGTQGQEMDRENPIERRLSELTLIVSALQERLDVITESYVGLHQRLNEQAVSITALSNSTESQRTGRTYL